MLFVLQEKVSGRHFFAFDRQSERWALSEVLTVQESVWNHTGHTSTAHHYYGCATARASPCICKQSKDNLLLNSCEINFY